MFKVIDISKKENEKIVEKYEVTWSSLFVVRYNNGQETAENNGETGKKGGIAVKNVNNRIKLLFGEEYGIYIYSQPDVGTDVEITLPVVRN